MSNISGLVMQVSREDLIEQFRAYGRGTQFSNAALDALHDYYEEYSDSCGEPVVLDVIAICCDWSEYTVEEALEEYDADRLEDLMYDMHVIKVDEDTLLISG